MVGLSGTLRICIIPTRHKFWPVQFEFNWRVSLSAPAVCSASIMWERHISTRTYRRIRPEAHAALKLRARRFLLFLLFLLNLTYPFGVRGPQHSDATQPPLPPARSWSPLLTASLSWQGQRTSLAASYARIVTGGGGLAGAYHSNIANVSGRWQISRTWTARTVGELFGL